MTKQVNHFINGRRAAGGSGRTHAVYNPKMGRYHTCASRQDSQSVPADRRLMAWGLVDHGRLDNGRPTGSL
jgi:hypothetical protein